MGQDRTRQDKMGQDKTRWDKTQRKSEELPLEKRSCRRDGEGINRRGLTRRVNYRAGVTDTTIPLRGKGSSIRKRREKEELQGSEGGASGMS